MVELLIALVLMGIVSAAVYTMLVNNQRIYRQQTQKIELNDNLRAATAILPSELRELDANDPLGSDIVEMTDSSLTYKAMRNLYVTCQMASGGTVRLDPTTMAGLRGLDAAFDSLLVFADSQTSLTRDDRWVHVNVTQVQTGNNCPGGRPSVDVSVSPSIQGSDSVLSGYPVRGFEVVDVRRYADASAVWWIGARRYNKSSGWSGLQPLAGPLGRQKGLFFTYRDNTATATAVPTQVARIDIKVVGRTSQPVRLSGSVKIDYLLDSLVTYVALRNSR